MGTLVALCFICMFCFQRNIINAYLSCEEINIFDQTDLLYSQDYNLEMFPLLTNLLL